MSWKRINLLGKYAWEHETLNHDNRDTVYQFSNCIVVRITKEKI